MFLMHAPFEHYVAEPYVHVGTSDVAPGGPAAPAKFHKYRVLLLVEYTNNPEYFEAQYPEFVRLLNKLHMLTDEMFLQYLAEPLARCAGKDPKANLSVRISELGKASLQSAQGLDSICSAGVLETYTFAATGEARTAAMSYDFSAPLKPKWLTEGGYVEQRSPPEGTAPTTPPEVAAPPATATPDAEPPPHPRPRRFLPLPRSARPRCSTGHLPG